jgi:deoxyribose-phosphate aldolase
MNEYTPAQIAAMIDHAVLAPNATHADLHTACEIAARCHVAGLCVRPCDIAETKHLLSGSGVLTGTVIGFPHGTTSTAAKAAEACQAVADGADELDMVVNLSRLIDCDTLYVTDDIAAVVQAASGKLVKVILECGYLSDEQIVAGCLSAQSAGAHFVKTSTGFGICGAKVEHVRLMRKTVGDAMGVKASGGIRSLADALAMIHAGANRLGTSSTEKILAEMNGQPASEPLNECY